MKSQMRRRAAIWVLPLVLILAPFAAAWQQGAFEIAGAVHDADGHAARNVSVRLLAQGKGEVEEHKTDSSGEFAFLGLKPGAYVVIATNTEQRSAQVPVTGSTGSTQHVELTLPAMSKAAGAAGSKPESESEMALSDVPNFTVAAVTDWTAAGGHGSDTTLRASESLTRETLRLKAEPAGTPSDRDSSERERRLREALEKSPRDAGTNRELGSFYLNAQRYSDAVAPLETACAIEPADKNDEYALALALARSGNPSKAHEHLAHLLAEGDKPEWERLSGEVDEKLGDPLGAVRAFERAAKTDPSEESYFAWGTELLEHRAIWQAKDVFESAVKAHPNSPRLLSALGTALFSAALYEESAQRLCEASDLIPGDVEPYLFMGRVQIAAPNSLPCIEARLKRFADTQPANALANYYYAMAYWKQHPETSDSEALFHVQALLSKAVEADPHCSSAYLQLGVIQASQSHFQDAADYYRKAVQADSFSTEAHYRLGVAYDRLGERDKAAEEFRLHDELEKQQALAVEKQRRDVKQFLVQIGDNQEKAVQP